ncbi:NAD(P)H-binding protein [Qipengyuania sp. S6317L1]|uniref:NAD(P)H-binding protein n=1 Tax=Qipengyuania sp. S6317L1 TaxID=2926410 RepID=UPI001FF170C1|nr:NAD(P)H-binding protein [Qipengyuania sp. S6317L1]MCK0100024.1 NAD(P)H-binding protein [Qipengyuania sp. S6317L1]
MFIAARVAGVGEAVETSYNPEGSAIAVAGASGTIGRAVVRALADDGRATLALMRRGPETDNTHDRVMIDTVPAGDRQKLAQSLRHKGVRTVISCMASRSGSPKDARAVDYRANLDLLKAAEEAGVEHFILLSAICVQRPHLAFQRAKLAFEAELIASSLAHTIVRPTAFFKSLSRQVERVRKGKPFLLFGNGELTRCKPISDNDLARFIVGCIDDPEARGAVLPIGGRGPAITLKEQGELLFAAAGMEPKFRSVPVWLFGLFASGFSLGAWASDWFAQKAEYARIARYYATQSMLLLDPRTGEYSDEATPEFGEERLVDHYRDLIGHTR